MKLPLLIVLAMTQYSSSPQPQRSTRTAYAQQLYLDTLSSMVSNGEDAASLVVEVHGEYGQILYIQDNDTSAKAFYTHISGDENTRASLLKLGFRVVVLVNADHGTFVIDLMTNNLDKEDTWDA